MGVINSPLVEGRVFSEEVNKKEVTVNGANSNKKSVRFSQYLAPEPNIIFIVIYRKLYSSL